jgi:hypothetical protein
MAQIYGNSGSFTQLTEEFRKYNINFLKSLEAINSFQEVYEQRLLNIEGEVKTSLYEEISRLKQQIESLSRDYDLKVLKRKYELNNEINYIDSAIASTKPYSIKNDDIFLAINNFFKESRLKQRKSTLDNHFSEEVNKPFSDLFLRISFLKDDLKAIENQFQERVEIEKRFKSAEIKTAKIILENKASTLLGAIGEDKAIAELKKLPENYSIINDFRYSFYRALHYRQTNEWIQTIQVDHLLIGPSGVSIIETKNWSQESIQNLDFHSPIKQVERTGYAVFVLLNRILQNNSSLIHHWGPVIIHVNQMILMINKKPHLEFEHVKIVTLNELRQHIMNLKPQFDADMVQKITHKLLEANLK